MSPFLAWLATQAIGPAVIARGMAELARSDFRTRLAKQVARALDGDVRFRRVRRWLDRPATWDLLVDPTEAHLEQLVELAIEALPRRRRRSGEARQLAERIVEETEVRFIQALDPALAVAVAHVREMKELAAIQTDVQELVAAQRGDVQLQSQLDQLPPTIPELLLDVASEKPETAHWLSGLLHTEPPVGDAELRRLLDNPPDQLKNSVGAPRVIGEYLEAHGRRPLALDFLQRAAEQRPPGAGRLFARAAAMAKELGDGARAERLITEARETAPEDVVVAAWTAALNQDWAGVLALFDNPDCLDDDRDQITGLALTALIQSDRLDDAISVTLAAVHKNSRASTLRLQLGEYLKKRAQDGSGDSPAADLRDALSLAVEARDLRRQWRGPSAQCVVSAFGAAIMLRELDEAFRLVMPQPHGDAVDAELGDPEVARLGCGMALERRALDLYEDILARVTDPFTEHIARAQRAIQEGSSGDAREHLDAAWDLVADDQQRREVETMLAELGVWPLPSQAELEDLEGPGPQYILARAQWRSGDVDGAVQRARLWQNTSPHLAGLLAEIYESQDDIAEARLIRSEAAERHRAPDLLEPAIRSALLADDIPAATEMAKLGLSLLPSVSTRRMLLRALAHGAQATKDWLALENAARQMLGDNPDDRPARWFLILGLAQQSRPREAWAALRRGGSDLDGLEGPQQALLWIQLHRRFGMDDTAVEHVLDLYDKYADEEQVAAVAMGAVLGLPENLELSDPLLARWNDRREDFFGRYPDSRWLLAVPVDVSPEGIRESLRDLIEPQARAAAATQREVWRGRAPYGLLSVVSRKPFASALVYRGAGCLLAETVEIAAMDEEERAAGAALDRVVVTDSSTLNLLSYLDDELRASTIGAFGRVEISRSCLEDIRRAIEDSEGSVAGHLGWNLDDDAPMFSEVDEEAQAQLLARLRAIHDQAAQLSAVNPPPLLSEFSNLASEQYVRPWLDAFEHARRSGIALLTDDTVMRALARGEGIPTFGTLALLRLLAQRGRCTDEQIASARQTLLENYFVDLDSDSLLIAQLYEQGNTPLAQFLMSRPAMWTNAEATLALYGRLCTAAANNAPEQLPNWLFVALVGVAGNAPDQAQVAAAALISRALAELGPRLTPPLFAALIRAARLATRRIGAESPAASLLKTFMDEMRSGLGTEVANPYIVELIQALDAPEHDVARRLLFGLSPT